MADTDQNQEQELVFDKSNLYNEKTYTDLKTGSIKQLIPVKADGSKDESRTSMFMGQTQVMSPSGPLPIQCMIEANNLEEAAVNFPGAINATVERIIEEAKKARLEEASRIVVPGQDAGSKIIT
jgi:hypothetical protein